MDATQITQKILYSCLLVLLSSFLLEGCNRLQYGSVNSPYLNGQSCGTQAIQNQFLVQWRETVPSEYEKFRLHPRSLVTRFTSFTKDAVEKEVLQKHLKDYSIAEYDFKTEKIEDENVLGSNVQTLDASGTWGPGDINVVDAWNFLGKKGDGVVVAVVDSGVDINHPLLQSVIWNNPGEIPGNGIDDDHNGFVDDVTGWDFNGNTAAVTDYATHGTHVSGIIAGASNGSFMGVAPNAKIMPVKFIDATGSGSVGDAIAGMDYAVAKGAKVINASWGGSDCSDILKQDIGQAAAAGTVFVNAAGNNHVDINVYPEWPAAFQVPGKITVASYNSSQFLSSFSNYGILVDLAAPGENILSTVPPTNGMESPNNLAIKSGTSMATPFVAGVAALLFAAKPGATAMDVVNAINNSVVPGNNFGVRTGGKLNALKAAQYLMSH